MGSTGPRQNSMSILALALLSEILIATHICELSKWWLLLSPTDANVFKAGDLEEPVT